MNLKNGQNLDIFQLKIIKNEKEVNFDEMMLNSDRNLEFELTVDDKKYQGSGIRGDDAIWIPVGEYGYKIIAENKKYCSLKESEDFVNKLSALNLNIFPKIKWAEIFSFEGKEFLVINMKNISSSKVVKLSDKDNYVPHYDRQMVERLLQLPTKDCENCITEFFKNKLKPEDEWYKSINLIGGKIVDFHRFQFMDDRYLFPSNGKTVTELKEIYHDIVSNYSKVIDHNGQQKWKGKIYQGYHFDNGYTFKGYSSDNVIFDSYKKLPFIPYGKVKGKKVLDIGSNQGFFSFQALIHGASEVVGLELQEEDVYAANKIKEILKADKATFYNKDAVEYIMSSQEKYGLIIANSVIHQIYKNLDGPECHSLLQKISNSCEYFAFESPVNHPTMTCSIGEIAYKLRKHFRIVRLINIYDAYSSGYRANFVCYS